MKRVSLITLLAALACFAVSCNKLEEERAQYLYQQVERLTVYSVYNEIPLEECVDLDAFSKDFASVIIDAEDAERYIYETDRDNFELGYEFFCYWLAAQDSSENDGFKGLRIVSEDKKAGTAEVEIDYVAYNLPQVHSMKLISEKGKWVIDNFDTQKETLREVLSSL